MIKHHTPSRSCECGRCNIHFQHEKSVEILSDSETKDVEKLIEVADELAAKKPTPSLQALGANIIVTVYKPNAQVGGIYIPQGAMERPWGEIVSIGPGRLERRIIDGDTEKWEHRPICNGTLKEGDKVIYTQGLKIEVPEVGGTLFIVEEEQIVAKVEGL